MSDNKLDAHTGSTQPVELQPNSPTSLTRRRLTSVGLGVSAIFTLAGRPVLAAQCTSPSAAASGNLSQHGAPLTCTGRTPGYWKQPQHANAWVAPYTQGTCSGGGSGNGSNGSNGSNGCSASPQNWTGGTLFHDVFAGSNFKVNNQSLSMNQVMVMNNNSYPDVTDPDNLGSHIVAALLNAASGKTNGVLSVMGVIGMWNEWVAKGYFEPSAGAKWNSAQIVAYLQTTMTV